MRLYVTQHLHTSPARAHGGTQTHNMLIVSSQDLLRLQLALPPVELDPPLGQV